MTLAVSRGVVENGTKFTPQIRCVEAEVDLWRSAIHAAKVEESRCLPKLSGLMLSRYARRFQAKTDRILTYCKSMPCHQGKEGRNLEHIARSGLKGALETNRLILRQML
jgi:hypothetical protein